MARPPARGLLDSPPSVVNREDHGLSRFHHPRCCAAKLRALGPHARPGPQGQWQHPWASPGPSPGPQGQWQHPWYLSVDVFPTGLAPWFRQCGPKQPLTAILSDVAGSIHVSGAVRGLHLRIMGVSQGTWGTLSWGKGVHPIAHGGGRPLGPKRYDVVTPSFPGAAEPRFKGVERAEMGDVWQ